MCFSGGWGIGLKHTLSRGTAKTCFNEKGDSDSVISTASVDIQTTVFDLYWRRCRGLTTVKLRQTNTISSRIHIYALVVYMSVYITKKRARVFWFFGLPVPKRRSPGPFLVRGFRRTAATYSPTWCGSTISASELNFSVRNGKRWILTAITTAYIT